MPETADNDAGHLIVTIDQEGKRRVRHDAQRLEEDPRPRALLTCTEARF